MNELKFLAYLSDSNSKEKRFKNIKKLSNKKK